VISREGMLSIQHLATQFTTHYKTEKAECYKSGQAVKPALLWISCCILNLARLAEEQGGKVYRLRIENQYWHGLIEFSNFGVVNITFPLRLATLPKSDDKWN
jgi:hypothetical protein